MSFETEKLTRVSVPELDEILGIPFEVLDDGFVRVIDYMGSDQAIVQAARVSYGAGTKKLSEDQGLIRYLLRNRHTSPFEMCEIKLHVRVPMDAWRQWIRHRTANVNEYSTRYSIAIDSTQTTAPDAWRIQAEGNRQGSQGLLDPAAGEVFSRQEKELQDLCRQTYQERLAANIAREQARKDLPLSTYTEAYWKIDLHNLLHFISLRMEEHAQLEIRRYATVIGEEIVKRWCPLAWQAFLDYQFNAMGLTTIDIAVIQALSSGGKEAARQKAEELGILQPGPNGLKSNRERCELEEKLAVLGLSVPWQD